MECLRYKAERDSELLAALQRWDERRFLKETSDEVGFIDHFFKRLWNYRANGEVENGQPFSLWPKFPVIGAGERGGTGQADLALGYFGSVPGGTEIPQVLCELKDIRSGLDAPQH
ncbi:MAG: hypothetical protein KDD67_15110 [Ignavibacteriae bacterium]|nr:hypothetical protein [Ignavibacteriota bacterium]MCB9217572.1 hypothetical protein [Ignavibacteria bacterium]